MPIAEDPEPRPAEGREPGGSDPSGAGGKDPFADLVLDEEFIKGATVQEQSGRTRMLAARWKHTPPVDPGGRRSVNDGPAKAAGRRFGRKPKAPALDAWGNPRPRRRPEWRAPLYVVLTIAVLLAALNIDGLRSWYDTRYGNGSGNGPAAARTPAAPVAPETAKPTAAPSAAADQQPTVDHPWKGSPVEGWPTSMDDFKPVDEPAATGVFGADQVAAQVALVKGYLAAANMDPKVIGGARPDAALAMLERDQQDDLNAALAKPSEEHDPTRDFARFDPREAILATDTVKVQGRITVEGDGDKGVLVHTDFTYVYALRPGPEAAQRAASPRPAPSAPPATKQPAAPSGGTAKPVGLVLPAADVAGDTWTTRTIVRKQEDFRFYDPARYRVNPKKLSFAKSSSDIGNSACDVYDGFLHPQFDQFAELAHPGSTPTGPATDPYDRTKDIQESAACGTLSRN